MTTHGTKDYRRDMAAIHDEVVRTGRSAIVTKDGEPYVKIVPATEDSVLRRLQDEGAVLMPRSRRQPIEPFDSGGDDSTAIIAGARR